MAIEHPPRGGRRVHFPSPGRAGLRGAGYTSGAVACVVELGAGGACRTVGGGRTGIGGRRHVAHLRAARGTGRRDGGGGGNQILRCRQKVKHLNHPIRI